MVGRLGIGGLIKVKLEDGAVLYLILGDGGLVGFLPCEQGGLFIIV